MRTTSSSTDGRLGKPVDCEKEARPACLRDYTIYIAEPEPDAFGALELLLFNPASILEDFVEEFDRPSLAVSLHLRDHARGVLHGQRVQQTPADRLAARLGIFLLRAHDPERNLLALAAIFRLIRWPPEAHRRKADRQPDGAPKRAFFAGGKKGRRRQARARGCAGSTSATRAARHSAR